MSNLPATKKKFPDGLAYHVAINKDSENSYDQLGKKLAPLFTDEEICSEYGITVEELWELKRDPEFKKAVLLCLRDVKENGDTVRLKQRMLFQHYAETWYPKLFDQTETGEHVAEKNKALTNMAKLGGLEVPLAKESGGTTVNTPALNIFLSAAPTPVVQQPMKDIIDVN